MRKVKDSHTQNYAKLLEKWIEVSFPLIVDMFYFLLIWEEFGVPRKVMGNQGIIASGIANTLPYVTLRMSCHLQRCPDLSFIVIVTIIVTAIVHSLFRPPILHIHLSTSTPSKKAFVPTPHLACSWFADLSWSYLILFYGIEIARTIG